MDFKVGVGKSDFADLRNSGNYYVDKTEIIYELVHDTDNKVTLFTRPRRFGKSVMANMVGAFFGKAVEGKDMFASLRIACSDYCQSYLNSQNLIYIDFSRMPRDLDEMIFG